MRFRQSMGATILFSCGHVIFSSLRHSQVSLAYRIMRARIFCLKYQILALYKRSEIVLNTNQQQTIYLAL